MLISEREIIRCCHHGTTNPSRDVRILNVDIDATVTNMFAETTIKYILYNTSKSDVTCVMAIPLNLGAVCDMRMTIDDVTTVAISKEKDVARREYNEAVQAGHSASILEQSTCAKDVFELDLGNFGGQKHATIQISIISVLTLETNNSFRYYLPTFVAQRYVPLSGTDIPHDSANVSRDNSFLSLKIHATMPSTLLDIQSPTHENSIATRYTDENKKSCEITLTNAVGLEQDFVITFTPQDVITPHLHVEKHDALGTTAVTLAFVPSIVQRANLKQEYIILVDKSGSMSEYGRMDCAKKALTTLIQSLPRDCYVNLIIFESSYRQLWQTSVLLNQDTFSELQNAVQKIYPGGGTELSGPLKVAFTSPLREGYARQIFLLTDGEVSNTLQLASYVRENSHLARLFVLGLGKGVSYDLVTSLARAGGGTAEFVLSSSTDLLTTKVMDQFKASTQPSLKDVVLEWDVDITETRPVASVDEPVSQLVVEAVAATAAATSSIFKHVSQNVTEVQPAGFSNSLSSSSLEPLYTKSQRNIPPMFSNKLFVYSLICHPGAKVPTKVTIRVTTDDGPIESTVDTVELSVSTDYIIHKSAVRSYIDDIDYVPLANMRPSENALATKLAKDYNLASRFTSFVAVQFQDAKKIHAISTSTEAPAMEAPAASFGLSSNLFQAQPSSTRPKMLKRSGIHRESYQDENIQLREVVSMCRVGLGSPAAAPASAGFGQSASIFGLSASGFGQSASGFGQSASTFGLSASGFGQSASTFGLSASGFGLSASGFGLSNERGEQDKIGKLHTEPKIDTSDTGLRQLLSCLKFGGLFDLSAYVILKSILNEIIVKNSKWLRYNRDYIVDTLFALALLRFRYRQYQNQWDIIAKTSEEYILSKVSKDFNLDESLKEIIAMI
jgi:hypothetical protein